MKRRLRKKKHLGEFQEFAFEVAVHLRPDADLDGFLDDFIENAIEKHDLQFGGGAGGREVNGVVELGRRDVYETNRKRVLEWLKRHASVESFTSEPPLDVWYGDWPLS